MFLWVRADTQHCLATAGNASIQTVNSEMTYDVATKIATSTTERRSESSGRRYLLLEIENF